MKTQSRNFTLEEANSFVPQLESLLARVAEKRTKCEKLHDVFFVRELIAEVLPEEKGAAALEDEAKSLDHLVAELEKDISLLRETGCRIRNLERGCIDFFGRHAGEMVYFCWARGEKSIRYYHPLNDAAIRLPL